jgi:hypothetical protein
MMRRNATTNRQQESTIGMVVRLINLRKVRRPPIGSSQVITMTPCTCRGVQGGADGNQLRVLIQNFDVDADIRGAATGQHNRDRGD